MTMETGNAFLAGAQSRGWMVGDLESWARARGEHLSETVSPRQSTQVEVKWYVHPPGDRRPEWALDNRYTTLTIIVDGELHIAFRESPNAEIQHIHLEGRGDYAIWNGDYCSHTWSTDAGCTLVTVRWPRS